MLKEERQQRILEKLHTEGKVLAGELSAALQVSEDTIRRDLGELAEAGRIQRVHGGALPKSPATAGFVARQHQGQAAKAAIAQAAAGLLRNGQVVILDGGTTAVQVARRLPIELHATVITNSPAGAVELAGHPSVDVIIIGGRLYKESLVAVGAVTAEALSDVRADLCLLGVCSLHPEIGISVPDYEEAQIKRAMIESSAEVVALASAEKLGTAAPYVVAPISALTHLVTEKDVADETLEQYRAAGVSVVKA
jgi:DeoR/GlpR family transcriptional regulator of sugar metabolism